MKFHPKYIISMILSFALIFCFFINFQNYSEPTTIISNEDMMETKPYDMVLTQKEALDDVNYAFRILKEHHPAFLPETPSIMQKQYNLEIEHIAQTPQVYQIWQAVARIYSKLVDAHTMVGIHSASKTTPIKFNYKNSLVSCSTTPYANNILTKVNQVPITEIYETFIDQSSFERV